MLFDTRGCHLVFSFKSQHRSFKFSDYLLLVMLLFPVSGSADYQKSPAMVNLTFGQVGIADNIKGASRYGLEYRTRPYSKWALVPAVGFARAENGATFVYADLRHDFWLNDRWVVIPSFGVGAFDDTEEIDLGETLEFRSGVELAYRFYGQYRVGVAVFHLSNGGLSDKNPGTEALVISLCIPLEG